MHVGNGPQELGKTCCVLPCAGLSTDTIPYQRIQLELPDQVSRHLQGYTYGSTSMYSDSDSNLALAQRMYVSWRGTARSCKML